MNLNSKTAETTDQPEQKTVAQRYSDWLASGTTGASAKTIASVMLGRENPSISYPRDSGDFGRCVRLLRFVPEWKLRLDEMKEVPDFHAEIWADLVKVWDQMEALLEDGREEALTEAIKQIITPIEEKSGKVGRLPTNGSFTASISTPVALPAKQTESDQAIEAEQKRVDDEKAEKPELPGIGEPKDVGGVAGQRLRSFIERVERLEEEKAALSEDIKEVYAEAKGTGFDTKTMRKIVALRKMDHEKRREAEELLDLYKNAIGMY